MMRQTAIAATLCLVAATGSAWATDWYRFTNDRFGFSVDIPSTYRHGTAPANGDGLAFTSPDGRSVIRAYGHLLIGISSFAEYEKETETLSKDLPVTYRQATEQNFTLSGHKGDQVFYIRAVATCRGDAAAAIWAEYPASQKLAFDPIIKHMAMTLRGSTSCW